MDEGSIPGVSTNDKNPSSYRLGFFFARNPSTNGGGARTHLLSIQEAAPLIYAG